MLHATYTDRYSAYIRRKQLLPPFDEIFQISLVRSCVKVRLLVFGFLSKNAAKILLFFDICKKIKDFFSSPPSNSPSRGGKGTKYKVERGDSRAPTLPNGNPTSKPNKLPLAPCSKKKKSERRDSKIAKQ